MTQENYKYIDIDNVSIAYRDQGTGQPILFIHGFASSSYTWTPLIEHLPQNFRFISIDLKGTGYSDKVCDDRLTLFDQAIIVKEFIKRMDLDDLILVGHSMGGIISLLALFDEDISKKVKKLILLNSIAGLNRLFDYYVNLKGKSFSETGFRLEKEDLTAFTLLEQMFFDKRKIVLERVKEYGSILRLKNAKECLTEIAKQGTITDIQIFYKNVKRISVPTIIIWGEKDKVLDIEYAYFLQNELKDAKFKLIPDCGHIPQEEKPLETAKAIAAFVGMPTPVDKGVRVPKQKAEQKTEKLTENKVRKNFGPMDYLKGMPVGYFRKLSMRRLTDRWTPSILFMLFVLKLLQVCKKLGLSAGENGWRKLSGIFLRNEHSKFMLTVFRLNYHSLTKLPSDMRGAKNILIDRLADSLRRSPSCHWALEWKKFRAGRKRIYFTDIVEAEFDGKGHLVKLIPHFDNTRETFTLLKEAIIQKTLKKIIRHYNENEKKRVGDHKRAWKTYKSMRRWVYTIRGLSFPGRHELCHLIERVLNSTFIQFELLGDTPEQLAKDRFAIPRVITRRHPGFGLLNIICRFTTDYSESDLWLQYHHVPVDGMPMQEMLSSLKQEWGAVGPTTLPALSSSAGKPELFSCGGSVVRGRSFVNFERFLKFRSYLNKKYYVEMGGNASLASLIVWGLAQQKYFDGRKFLIPLDTELISNYPRDRNISFIIIRPGKYFDKDNPLQGFFNYQRAYNEQIFLTKLGKSETFEVFELYAMVHPLICWGANQLIPKAMGEILGTAGLTMLKDADLVVSPLTDLQFNGFAALGNLRMPTEDGKTAGGVTFSGTKREVKEYIEGFNNLAEYLPDYLGIKF